MADEPVKTCECVDRNVTVTPFRHADTGELAVQVDFVCPECIGIYAEEIRDQAAMACIGHIQGNPNPGIIMVAFL